MRIIKKCATLFLGMILITSCLNNGFKPDIPIVEDFFDWKTVNQVRLEIPVSTISGEADNYYRTVNIYSSSSYNPQYLMISGSALPSKPFACTISVPANMAEIYIEVIGPDGSNVRSSRTVSYTAPAAESSTKAEAVSIPDIDVPEWTVPSEYDVEFTSDITSYYCLYDNTKYLVPAGYDIVSTALNLFNYKDWTNSELYIAGKITFENNIRGKNYTIIVLPGGELVVNKTFISDYSTTQIPIILYVMEGGKVTLNNGISAYERKTIVNKGEIVLADNQKIYLKGSTSNWVAATLYNTGIIHSSILGISDNKTEYARNIDLELDGFGYLFNDGTIYADDLNSDQKNSYGISQTVTNYSNGVLNLNSYEQTGPSQYNLAMMANYGYINTSYMSLYGTYVDNTGFIGADVDGKSSSGSDPDLKTDCCFINLYDGSMIETGIWEIETTHVELKAGSIFSAYRIYKGDGWSNNYQIFSNDQAYSLLIVNEDLESLRSDNSTILNRIEVWHKRLGSDGNTMDDYQGQYNGLVLWVKDLADRVTDIPESPYNKGYGVIAPPAPVDNDGDGVLSDVDIDDHDPVIAYRSYYPNTSDYGSILFEDLWPYTGDYDMNDLVCDYHIEWTQNASNEVVYMDFYWKLRALGATKKLAMAFQIDSIYSSAVSRVEHSHDIPTSFPMEMVNGMESGQNFPVIPLFNDAAEFWGVGNDSLINTIPDYPIFESGTESCRVWFAEPINMQSVMLNHINPFLIASAFDDPNRYWEIHLPGFKRTNKASTIINNQAGLSANDPYLSNTGMMWGLMLPQSIKYTRETVNIEYVYLHFREWYVSKGESYPDWYMDKPGYINTSGLYSNSLY